MIAVHHSVYAICCNRIGGNSFCACVLACVGHHTDNNKQQRNQRNEHGVHNGERLALACQQAPYLDDVGGSMVRSTYSMTMHSPSSSTGSMLMMRQMLGWSSCKPHSPPKPATNPDVSRFSLSFISTIL